MSKLSKKKQTAEHKVHSKTILNSQTIHTNKTMRRLNGEENIPYDTNHVSNIIQTRETTKEESSIRRQKRYIRAPKLKNTRT